MSVFDPMSSSYDPRSYTPVQAGPIKTLEEHRLDFARIAQEKLKQLQTEMVQSGDEAHQGVLPELSKYEADVARYEFEEIVRTSSREDPMERRMTAWERLHGWYTTLLTQ